MFHILCFIQQTFLQEAVSYLNIKFFFSIVIDAPIPILEHLASYGFIVAGNEDTMSGYGTSSSETLDFMIKINEEKNNIFFNKIEIDNVGISGHSQGGAGAINAVTKFQNSKNYKALFTASCMSDYFADTKCYEIKMINIPYFAITSNGFFDESCIGLTNKNFDILNENLINVCAVRKGVNHGDMLWAGDGYMTAWFCYILKGDKKAKEIFCGKHPEIENNNLKDNVRRKNCEN